MTQTAPPDQLRAFVATLPFSSPQIPPLFAELNPVFSAADLPNHSFSGVVHA